MAEIIKYIKWIISKIIKEIFTRFIESKWKIIIAIIISSIAMIITFFKSLPLHHQILFILASSVLVGILVEWMIKIYNYFAYPNVLEIIYDGKYNKQRYIEIHKKYSFTYTIVIKNISKKTVKSVFVTVESEHTLHYNTNKYSCDINPDATELFILYATNKNLLEGKEILVKVTGQNIKSAERKIIL